MVILSCYSFCLRLCIFTMYKYPIFVSSYFNKLIAPVSSTPCIIDCRLFLPHPCTELPFTKEMAVL